MIERNVGIGDNNPPDAEQAGNWFAVSRDTFDHPIIGIHGRPFTEFEAWLWLLASASYETKKALNKGTVIVLDPGDLMAAHGYLATRWVWSVDKVRWFLKRLQVEAMITRACTKSTTRNTNQIQIITICNYSRYQGAKVGKHQPEHQANTKPTPSQHQANTKNLTSKQINNKPSEEVTSGSDDPVADATLPSALEALRAFEAYNALAQRIGLPVSRTLTPARRRSLQARMREHGGFDAWTLALANVERSAFLRGSNSKGWRADFDFLLQASRFAKLVDGSYGNGAHGDTLAPKETELEKIRRLVGQAAEHQGQRRLVSHE